MLVPVLLAVILLLAFGDRPLRRALKGAGRLWRPTTGLLAVAVLMGAAVLAVREDWVFAALFLVLAAALALGARKRGARAAGAGKNVGAAPAAAMSPREARAILGVPEGAGADAIEAAYRRLMRLAHPDQGGTAGLAAQLNAARAALRTR